MRLIEPSKEFEESWHEALAEFQAEGRKGFWNREKEPTSLEDYILLTSQNSKGENVPEGWVPSSTFWLIDNGEFVGHTNLRHTLNESLKEIGGHIGYYIRPSARGKGYGTKILELALIEAKKLGIQKVLVSCNEDNLASKRVIEKNKGLLQDRIAKDGEPFLRFWIDLS
jgi:predicted acetyltransferase